MTDDNIGRRRFLAAAGTAAVTGLALPLQETAPAAAAEAQSLSTSSAVPSAAEPFLVLTPSEAAFMVAAVDTLIPADQLTPSGSECGVVVFIDRQLAGNWGAGGRFYRSGPFIPGKPEQGYQLSLTPLEFFRAGIAAANAWSRKTYGKDFDHLGLTEREAALKTVEAGKAEFPNFPSKTFFEQLLQVTMEGFFADPMYGGNRDKVAWKMMGYPGLPALYADKVEAYRGKKLSLPPQSIADFS